MRIALCVDVDVGATSLGRLLRSLAVQRFERRPEPAVFVIVAEVKAAATLHRAAAGAAGAFRWPVAYVSGPAPAECRRRAVALALERGADHVAFLESAALPAQHWLDELLAAQARHRADVVEGPVVPRYAESVPAWVRRGGFFESPRRRTGAAVPLARPHNVLVRRALLAAAAGGTPPPSAAAGGGTDPGEPAAPRVVWADRAVVETDVDPERATARWILRRAFRERSPVLPPHVVALGRHGVTPSAARALVRMAEGGFLLSVAVFLGRAGVMHALCRVSRGAGELAAALRGSGIAGSRERV